MPSLATELLRAVLVALHRSEEKVRAKCPMFGWTHNGGSHPPSLATLCSDHAEAGMIGSLTISASAAPVTSWFGRVRSAAASAWSAAASRVLFAGAQKAH